MTADRRPLMFGVPEASSRALKASRVSASTLKDTVVTMGSFFAPCGLPGLAMELISTPYWFLKLFLVILEKVRELSVVHTEHIVSGG